MWTRLLACIRSNNVEFAGGVQHDSSLFLKYLLECLHEATKQLVSDPREKSGLSELQRVRKAHNISVQKNGIIILCLVMNRRVVTIAKKRNV
jgi:ubiquitin C-terminal hydrolase